MKRHAFLELKSVRHPNGYRIASGGKERFVVPVEPRETQERYQLPDDLFLCFAQLDPAEDAIAQFATAFGPLGGHLDQILVEREKSRRKKRPSSIAATLVRGESLSSWRYEIAQMLEALKRLSVARSGVREPKAIRPLRIPTVRILDPRNPGSHRTINARDFDGAKHRLWPGERVDRRVLRESSLKEPAIWGARDLAEMINRHLADAPLQCVVTYPSTLTPLVVPRTLLASMWAQLLESLAYDKAFHQCVVCNRWMSAEAKPRAHERKTCSARCRQRLYVQTHCRRKARASR